jgi:hypothetical protein
MEIVWEVGDTTLNLAKINAELTNPPPSNSHYQWNINEQEIEDFRSVGTLPQLERLNEIRSMNADINHLYVRYV